jgi:uncharacterized protein
MRRLDRHAAGVLAILTLTALAVASCTKEGSSPRGDTSDPASSAGSESGAEPETPRAARPGPRVIFEPEGREPASVTVELASTPAAIQRGLMYREHLPLDHGMLFIFPDEEIRTFWMKNTLIPLDMIFVSSDKHVAGIVERAEPRTTTPRRVETPSQYVVEVNGGWARAHGVEVGTPVRFVEID